MMLMRSLRSSLVRPWFVMLFLGLLVPIEVFAQSNGIRFPVQPIEGRPVRLEMYWAIGSCGGSYFTGDLYDQVVSGHEVRATIDVVEVPPTWGGVCPDDFVGDWAPFHLAALPIGNYQLNVYRNFPERVPAAEPELFLSTAFAVAAVPEAPSASDIPAMSTWSLSILLAAVLSLGVALARRR